MRCDMVSLFKYGEDVIREEYEMAMPSIGIDTRQYVRCHNQRFRNHRIQII